MKKKIRIHNHWEHWQAHIIIFGIQLVHQSEGNTTYAGLEICIFGIGIELYDKIIDWMLVSWWDMPKENLKYNKHLRIDL